MVVEKKGSLVEKFFEEFGIGGADTLTKLTACEMLYLVNIQFTTLDGKSVTKDLKKAESFPKDLSFMEETLVDILDLAGSWSNDLVYTLSIYLEKQGIQSKLIDKLDTPRKEHMEHGYGAIHAFMIGLGYSYK